MEEKTNELTKIEPRKFMLKIGGREREIKFNFSAWKEIEIKYGSVNNVQQLVEDISERPFQTLPEIIYISLVDKEGVTKENCLDEYGLRDMQEITNIITQALNSSLPADVVNKKKLKKMEK